MEEEPGGQRHILLLSFLFIRTNTVADVFLLLLKNSSRDETVFVAICIFCSV